MKKIRYCIFFVICIFCFSLSIKANGCDANSDGKINSEDSALIQKMISGYVEIPKEGSKEFKAADCNNDGEISVLDATDTSKKASKVSCGTGEGMITDIPGKIPELTSFAVDLVQVAVPVLLIVMGTIDLFKGVTAGKEDEMKKGQGTFVKRLILAALIFFIVVVVKFLISVIADTNQTNIVDCIDCFVSNDC